MGEQTPDELRKNLLEHLVHFKVAQSIILHPKSIEGEVDLMQLPLLISYPL